MGSRLPLLVLPAAALVAASGCSTSNETEADRMIAQMDAMPADQQVPGWENVRTMMLRDAPQVGDTAPDFELETRDGTETVSLSGFRGNTPVVLIFGSWT